MSVPPVTPDATPSDVATLIRARTKDSSGRELGEWTDETRPTLEQVQATLDIAQRVVAAHVGYPVEACQAVFQTAVAYEAVCLIEKGYFNEQITSGRSAYEQWRAEADALLLGVRECQQGNLPDQAGTGGATVYDIHTPSSSSTCVWPPEYWQRDLDRQDPL
jgi:hypothetical protein